MSFSERYEYTKKLVQIDSINDSTRIQLWNQIHSWILTFGDEYRASYDSNNDEFDKPKNFFIRIWAGFFNLKINYFPSDYEYEDRVIRICDEFLDKCTWYRYYDFIEFLIKEFKTFSNSDVYTETKDNFHRGINKVLKKELCTYRLVEDLFVPIANENEIFTIADSLDKTANINTVHTHLKQALQLFSDRENPDYRNSAKESISALESLLKLVVKSPKATLTDSIKKIKNSELINIHPSIINTINSLYAWAGDESGIRHSLKSNDTVDIEDSQFTLIACCGLISYLTIKSSKAGITL
ncbi:hypothetical protein GCM10027578_23490 [Spirosoma luteolum]